MFNTSSCVGQSALTCLSLLEKISLTNSIQPNDDIIEKKQQSSRWEGWGKLRLNFSTLALTNGVFRRGHYPLFHLQCFRLYSALADVFQSSCSRGASGHTRPLPTQTPDARAHKPPCRKCCQLMASKVWSWGNCWHVGLWLRLGHAGKEMSYAIQILRDGSTPKSN